jgi:hypothetical protein
MLEALRTAKVISAVRPRLAEPFRGVSDENLTWLGSGVPSPIGRGESL